MDSFEFNKIAGAVLSALLVVFGARTLIEVGRSGHGHEVKAGYTLPAPKAGAATAAAPAAEPFTFAKVAAVLPKASPENGEGTFKKCGACHTGEKGGPNRVGPNLYGVVGRKAGSKEGFAYSDGIKAVGDWSWDKLAAFLHNPKAVVPSTKMVFAGVEDTGELADLLAYMRTLSDAPVELPK